MDFVNFDLVSRLAREHQQELIRTAAEQRVINQARASHPSRWQRHRSPNGGPEAA